MDITIGEEKMLYGVCFFTRERIRRSLFTCFGSIIISLSDGAGKDRLADNRGKSMRMKRSGAYGQVIMRAFYEVPSLLLLKTTVFNRYKNESIQAYRKQKRVMILPSAGWTKRKRIKNDCNRTLGVLYNKTIRIGFDLAREEELL